MKMTIHSRTLNKDVTFSRPGSGSLFADLGGKPGTLKVRICACGKTKGVAISYFGDSKATFEGICRSWFRAYLQDTKWERDIDDRFNQ